MRYTSASAMPSSGKVFRISCLTWIAVVLLAFCSAGDRAVGGMIDRVVATVNNRAITLSELSAQMVIYREGSPAISEEAVLDAMINTLLLVEKARALKLEGASDAALVTEYIEVKIRSRILIREEQIRKFFEENRDSLGGKDYLAVRDEIEVLLAEAETNRQLKAHLEELREKADIVIQLKAPE